MPSGSAVGQIADEGAKKSGFRPDIQGLRMVAVLAVILDHLFSWPSGGFVGVDVFFVISGFLITGLLLREHDRTGSISFSDFYRRRIKRIMPAAILVIIVTLVASWFLFSVGRFNQTIVDGLWAFFFAANWNFAASGTDYFQADGPLSPLQHYWSLSVEEQFYFVWPWIMLLIFWIAARRPSSTRFAQRAISLAIVAITILSFAWSIWETATNPGWAYFSTFSRTWELGVGAIIAIAASSFSRIPNAIRPVLAWIGLAGIVASLFIISDAVPFPSPWAALPVLATALVIIAGSGGPQRALWPLTNPVSRYLGDVSYSLYLWHFPVIILLGVVFAPDDIWYYVSALVTMFTISVLSYHGIEDPIRRSGWLNPRPRERRRGRRRHQSSDRTRAIWTYGGLGACLVMTTTLVGLALIPPTPPVHVSSSAPQIIPSATATPEATAAPVAVTTEALDALTGEISAALDATAWPDNLTPALDDLGSEFTKADAQGCAPATPSGKDCTVPAGDMSRTAVVVGDSMAVAWLPAIRAALEPQGWRVFSMTYIGCSLIDADTGGSDATIVAACPAHKQLVAESIAAAKPGLVIMSNNYGVTFANETPDLFGTWGAALTSTYQNWLSPAGRVVTLSAPPMSSDPEECATRFSTPADCVGSIPERWAKYATTDEASAEQAGGYYINTRDWFCSTDDRCPAFVGTTTVRRDATHITADYAEKIAPVLSASLEPYLP